MIRLTNTIINHLARYEKKATDELIYYQNILLRGLPNISDQAKNGLFDAFSGSSTFRSRE